MNRLLRVAYVPDNETPSREHPLRKPWIRPELVEYGSVAKLTQTGGSTRLESSVPANRMK